MDLQEWVKVSGQRTLEKRRGSRGTTRPTPILNVAEICLCVEGGMRASVRATVGQSPRNTCEPVEEVEAVRK